MGEHATPHTHHPTTPCMTISNSPICLLLRKLITTPPPPREKISCKLVSKTSISHDVRLLRFALP